MKRKDNKSNIVCSFATNLFKHVRWGGTYMKRRNQGEGTIYQRKDGLWVWEINVQQLDGSYKRKRLTASDKSALQKKITDFKYSVDRNIITDSKNLTLNEWIDIWLSTYVLGKVKNTTYDNYVYAFDCHIKPSIGKHKIEKITPAVVQMFVNSLAEKGLSVSTIKKSVIVMNQAYKKAVLNNIVHSNPCHDISYPKKPPRKVMAMTAEEQEAFIKACPNTTYGNMFIFALNTGLRMGEILALCWDDVDLKNRKISVKNTVVRVTNRDEDATSKITTDIHSVKTDAGVREIPLTNVAYSILKMQKEKCSFFCFESTNGKILEKRNIVKALNKVIKNAGIKTKVTMHVLRHSFATRLLEKGANIKAVSEILGHKSIQITLDIYSHVLPDFKDETISLLN